jgi:hypothetical protein
MSIKAHHSIKHDPWLLEKYGADELTDANVLRGCLTDGEIYKIVAEDERFQSNIDICIAAVKSCGAMIDLMPSEIQQRADVQSFALRQCSKVMVYSKQYVVGNGYNISNASDQIKDDYDLVFEAVKCNPRMYQYVSGRLKKNREIILEAMKNCTHNFQHICNILALDEYKNDYHIIMKAVSGDGLLFSKIPEALKFDKELAVYAVSSNGLALQHVPTSLQDDDDVVRRAVQNNGLALEFASERLRDDYDIVEKAIENNTYAKAVLPFRTRDPDYLKRDQAYLKVAIRYASQRCMKNELLGKKALSYNYLSIRYVCETLKDDYDAMYEMVYHDFEMFDHLSPRLKGNKELAKLFISKGKVPAHDMVLTFKKANHDLVVNYNRDGYSFLRYLNKELCDDEEIVRMAIAKLGCDLQYANEAFQSNREMVDIAIKNTPFAYRYISSTSELKSDEGLALQTLKGRNGAYLYSVFSEELKLNVKLATFALKTEDELFYCLPDALISNREFMMSIFTDIDGLYSKIQFLPEQYRDDAEFMIGAMEKKNSFVRDRIMKCVSDRLKDDDDFISKMVQKDERLIMFASDRIKSEHLEKNV